MRQRRKLQKASGSSGGRGGCENRLCEGNARARTETNGGLFSPNRVATLHREALGVLALTAAGSHLRKNK